MNDTGFIKHTAVICLFLLLSAGASGALAETGSGRPASSGASGWSSVVRGGAVGQVESDLDGGGGFSSTRLNIEAGSGYGWSRTDTVSLALSYSYDGYSFSSGGSGLASRDPWGDIHTVSLSMPVRYGISDQWTAFLIPSLSSTGESGAEFGDTLTGGGFAGVSYRF